MGRIAGVEIRPADLAVGASEVADVVLEKVDRDGADRLEIAREPRGVVLRGFRFTLGARTMSSSSSISQTPETSPNRGRCTIVLKPNCRSMGTGDIVFEEALGDRLA